MTEYLKVIEDILAENGHDRVYHMKLCQHGPLNRTLSELVYFCNGRLSLTGVWLEPRFAFEKVQELLDVFNTKTYNYLYQGKSRGLKPNVKFTRTQYDEENNKLHIATLKNFDEKGEEQRGWIFVELRATYLNYRGCSHV